MPRVNNPAEVGIEYLNAAKEKAASKVAFFVFRQKLYLGFRLASDHFFGPGMMTNDP